MNDIKFDLNTNPNTNELLEMSIANDITGELYPKVLFKCSRICMKWPKATCLAIKCIIEKGKTTGVVKNHVIIRPRMEKPLYSKQFNTTT